MTGTLQKQDEAKYLKIYVKFNTGNYEENTSFNFCSSSCSFGL